MVDRQPGRPSRWDGILHDLKTALRVITCGIFGGGRPPIKRAGKPGLKHKRSEAHERLSPESLSPPPEKVVNPQEKLAYKYQKKP